MSIYAVILFCLLSAVSSPTTAEEIGSGKEIIMRMDTLMRGETSAGMYEMTVRDPNWERTLRLRVWDKIIYWVRMGDYVPLRQEFYSERGELIRVMTFSGIKEIGGRVIPTLWKMRPVKKEGKETILRIIDVEFNKSIDEDVFTLRNLTRVR